MSFPPALVAEVAAFVADEARLLDDLDFAAWLALYAEDARYWVPVSTEQRTPTDGPMHFHDDRQLMMARTHRLMTPRAFGRSLRRARAMSSRARGSMRWRTTARSPLRRAR